MGQRSALGWLSVTVLGLVVGCSSNLTGGTGGSGGNHNGTGGVPGTGGVVGTGGAAGTCQAISASYQVALAAAQSCGFDAGGQCGELAPAALPVSGCVDWCGEVPVNDNSALNALEQQWQAAGCQGPGACLYPPCVSPPSGQCVAIRGGSPVCQRASSPGTGGVTGSGGAVGTGGTGEPVSCGTTICTASEFCCDPLCSVCTPVGSLCSTGCKVGPDAGTTATGACASLAAEYDEVVAEVRSCSVAATAGCPVMVHASLATSNCNCDFVYATDATKANSILQTWLSLGCQPKSTCIEQGCVAGQSTPGACVATDGGVSGVCQATPIGLL